MIDNELVSTFLPPETSTPMPPMLAYVYDRGLGWPGRPEKRPRDDPGYLAVRLVSQAIKALNGKTGR